MVKLFTVAVICLILAPVHVRAQNADETQLSNDVVSRKFFDHHTRCLGALVRRHPEMFDDEGGYLPDSPKGWIWERVATEHPEYAAQVGGVCMAMETMEKILHDEA